MKQCFTLFSLLLLLTSVELKAQLRGCPDHAALNYNPNATINDGSCNYKDTTIKVKTLYNLDPVLNESSGLLYFNKLTWSHDDSGGEPDIYAMNKSSNAILQTVTISNGSNVDWEDIAQDKKYIYVGDFGNNANGNRTDLKIYRIKKSKLTSTTTSVTADIINFSYEDQENFTATGSNNTNFDCEALIAYNDSLFLFSKDWLDNKTRLYALPALPGTYVAKKKGELDVQGLITGAEVLSAQRVIVLTGYNSLLTPFIYMLYDFNGTDFFAANKRKVGLNATFSQTEGICAITATKFYISNEKFSQFPFNTPARLQQIDLSALLNPYYHPAGKLNASNTVATAVLQNFKINRQQNSIYIEALQKLQQPANIVVTDFSGKVWLSQKMETASARVNTNSLPKGNYIVSVKSNELSGSLSFFKE